MKSPRSNKKKARRGGAKQSQLTSIAEKELVAQEQTAKAEAQKALEKEAITRAEALVNEEPNAEAVVKEESKAEAV
eukprot:2956366-Karenia_brevis.AAC.1